MTHIKHLAANFIWFIFMIGVSPFVLLAAVTLGFGILLGWAYQELSHD